jgi:hypothetical protein
VRTSFHHQSEAQPPNGPLTAATSPDTPSYMPSHAVWCLWDLTLPLELIHVNWRRRRKPSVLRLPSATSAATFPIHRASLFSPLRR